MDAKTILQSKVTTILLTGVLIVIMVVSARLIIQKRSVDAEISRLQRDADQVEKNSQELSGLIKYLETPEYTELQAREKLNLKKEGEQVVVLPKDAVPDATAPEDIEPTNPIKWFNYFFSQRSWN